MKKYFILVSLMLAAVIGYFSSSQIKFDHIEPTENECYSIVYNDGKCGVYDNNADCLVTAMKYDNLKYLRSVVQDSIEITVWGCEKDSLTGLLSIAGENNEMMDILFP